MGRERPTPQQAYERAEARFRQRWAMDRGLLPFDHPGELREDLARIYERQREKCVELLWLQQEAERSLLEEAAAPLALNLP